MVYSCIADSYFSRKSRESREVFLHRSFLSHTDLTNLTKGLHRKECSQLSAAPSVRAGWQQGRSDLPFREIREICVRPKIIRVRYIHIVSLLIGYIALSVVVYYPLRSVRLTPLFARPP